MSFLQSPEPGRKVVRRYQLSGEGGITSVSSEMIPVVLIDDLTQASPIDTDFDRAGMAGTVITGVAAQVGQIQLLNPDSSGVQLSADFAVVSRTTAGLVSVREHDIALATNIPAFFSDRRIVGSPAATLNRESNAATFGTGVASFELGAADATVIPLGVVLAEGQGVSIACGSTNVTLTVAYYWSERMLLPGE